VGLPDFSPNCIELFSQFLHSRGVLRLQVLKRPNDNRRSRRYASRSARNTASARSVGRFSRNAPPKATQFDRC